ncbi:MAG: 2-oxo acid dehydrogenase subunit E2 [Bacilli bacterium]|nr:2-oxo acid dehydrogenase subunit E2 [Bacilli bacterium]MDD4283144.1 2-oxo acid dehydrogenase subunit E2 [Bacilli bacterium]MDD4719120.1 2-oxo acid dehydrogenase subunit E2 [Bacilli bacterium]
MSKDRRDGKYIKPEDSIHAIMPYLMKDRTEAEVYLQDFIDVTELKKYLNKKNKNIEDYKITVFHAFVTGISKTIYNRPVLNRFIAGKRIYQRNDVTISFVAKNKFSDDAEERLLVINAKEDMKLEDISEKIYTDVQKVRKEGGNSIDDTLKFVTSFPRCIVSIIMWVFRKLDFYGKVPKFISDGDPNYTTVLISNLGSIKSNACYHHLNNYGTNSIIVTIGEVREHYVTDSRGNVNKRDIVEVGITLDERIGDGFYFAKSFKLIKHILENPILLEEELSKVVDYEKEN